MRTERWGTFRLGDGEPITEYLGRIRAEVASLEGASRIQWTGRRIWSSHTYPGGCWICDAFGVIHSLLSVLESAYPAEEHVDSPEVGDGESEINNG